MSILTCGVAYADRLGNEIYTDYANMLRVSAAFADDDMNETDKWRAALLSLYGNMEEVHGDADALIQEFLWFYSGGKTVNDSKGGAELIDFEQDAEYIHADFLTAYGIDLAGEGCELHWWKFLSLIKALPEDMTMAKRMYYRGVSISKFKGEERKQIAKIKKSLAIKRTCSVVYKNAEDKEQSYKERMQKRANEMLKNRADSDNM